MAMPSLDTNVTTNIQIKQHEKWMYTVRLQPWKGCMSCQGQTMYRVTIRFKLDMGSGANLIPQVNFDRLQQQTLTPPMCGLVIYTGQRIEPKGETNILKFQVMISGNHILSKDVCVKLNRINRINELTNTPTQPSTAQEMVKRYKGLHRFRVN